MPAELSVAEVLKEVKTVEGVGISIESVGKDRPNGDEPFGTVVGRFWLHVLYIATDGSEIGVEKVEISDGVLTPVMKSVHAEAVKAHGGEPGDAGYPEQLEPQESWDDARAQLASGKTSDELVSILRDIGPDDQKWGRQVLVNGYASLRRRL